MTNERALELLNKVVDQMTVTADFHDKTVIQSLMDLGFAAEELVELHFDEKDIQNVISDNKKTFEYTVYYSLEGIPKSLSLEYNTQSKPEPYTLFTDVRSKFSELYGADTLDETFHSIYSLEEIVSHSDEYIDSDEIDGYVLKALLQDFVDGLKEKEEGKPSLSSQISFAQSRVAANSPVNSETKKEPDIGY